MLRVIKRPPEWETECPYCHAVIGYGFTDVSLRFKGMQYFIKCPYCELEEGISIPTKAEDRIGARDNACR